MGNGVYEPTTQVYNGKVLFHKKDRTDVWLRYVTCDDYNNWMVSSTAEKDSKKATGNAHCVEKHLTDPSAAKRWKVFNSSDNTWQEQHALVALRLLPPIQIRGCVGVYAGTVNGIFEPVHVAYNNRLLFRKKDRTDVWLRYVTFNDYDNWMVSCTVDKDSNNSIGYAYCVEKGLIDP